MRIGAHQPAVVGAFGGGVKMNHLARSMHASIGAACGKNFYRMVGDFGCAAFKGGLHADEMRLMRLILPAKNSRRCIRQRRRNGRFELQFPLQITDQSSCFGLLLGRTFLHHFLQQLTRTLDVFHIDVGASQVQLG